MASDTSISREKETEEEEEFISFGVRIVLLLPPACRKRRLKGGVRCSLVATSAAARCEGPRSYPGQGRNLDRVFCSTRTSVCLWDQRIGYQSQSQAWKLT